MTASPKPTLADWYTANQLLNANGTPTWMPWQLRTLGVVFDGVPLGDHPEAPPGDKKQSERLWEMDGSARALVSADLDGSIVDMSLVPVAPPLQTPDFEARLKDGRHIAIEHTRICGKTDKLVSRSLSRLKGRVSDLVAASSLPPGIVAFSFPTAPLFADVDATAEEMVRVMREVIQPAGSVRTPFGADSPWLEYFDVHWTVTNPAPPAEARVEPWLIKTDPQETADAIYDIIRKKAEKHCGYLRHGEAAWLTVWVDTNFCQPATVLLLLESMNVQRGPFEKIIVGCSTRALVFDADGVTPHQDF